MIVCVDASIVVKWFTTEDDSDQALRWLESHAGDEIVAPMLLQVEVASVFRRKLCMGEMTFEECLQALRLLEQLGFRYLSDPSIVARAFELSIELAQPTVYDTVYLAIAEKQHCELWTADERFARVASATYPFVRLLSA